MRSPATPARRTPMPRASPRGACASLLAGLLLGGASGRFVLEENSVILPSSSDYRAYENAWTVNFDNVNAVDFDILVVEVCREQPCPVQLERFSGLVECDELVQTFNDSAWYNHYISSQIATSSSLLCNNMHSTPDEVQIDSNVILQDSGGRPWVILRQPLSLEVVNEQELLSQWAHEINSTDVGIETSRPVYEIVLRITQVLKLQRVFALHQSLVRVIVVSPTLSSMVFSVQNPCAARGYAAPEFGGVTLKLVSERERCIWTCRVDLLRHPYNSVPATREQLNSSRAAGEDGQYACLALPRDWAAVFFGFEIDTRMIATADEYTQVLYDALDSMARGIEKEFANAGKTVLVALGVHDSIYHPQRFREQLREKAEATCLLTQCENRWFPDAEGWTNRYFVYADTRRDLDLENENWPTEYTAPSLISILYRWFLNRLVVFDVGGRGSAVGQATLPSLVPSFAHTQISNARARPPRVPRRIASPRRASQRRRTMSLHSLKIDGVIISDDLGILVEDSERLQLITDLRNAVYRQGEVLITFSASLQISRVEDFDISSVVGFVTPQATPAAKAPPTSANSWASNYIIIIVSISLIITGVMLLVCALLIRDVLANRRRRHEDREDPY